MFRLPNNRLNACNFRYQEAARESYTEHKVLNVSLIIFSKFFIIFITLLSFSYIKIVVLNPKFNHNYSEINYNTR